MKGLVAALLIVASTAWAAPAGLQTTTLGSGPTVVMIHNLGGTRTGWMPTARKLLPNYRVVLVDLPGHGQSPMPDPFTLQAGADAISQVLAAQKGESTVVVGQGMGAVMGMMALAAHPGQARGLVAIEMAVKKQFAISDQQMEFFLSYLEQNYNLFIKQMFTKLGRDSAQGVAIHAQAMQVPRPAMTAYIREMVSFDPAGPARKLKTPLLLVATERLWKANADSALMAEDLGYGALPEVHLRRMGNCGLMVASEQPDSLAALIAGFSRQVLKAR